MVRDSSERFRPSCSHRRLLTGLLIATGLGATAGCARSFQSTLTPAGPAAERVAGLWWLLFWIAVAVSAVVVAMVGWAVLRRRGPRTRVRPAGGRSFVLVLGVAVPAVVLTFVYAVGLSDMRALAEPPRPPEFTVEVVGHMWWWEVRYPDAGFTTANEIHIPVGEPVALRLTTDDVIHSFWVPELMPKMDLLPERVNETWFLADEPGTYRGQCAEYCGLQHSHMAFQVVAEPRERFDAWLAKQSRPAQEPATELAARGRTVLETTACATCHTVAGTGADGDVGPDLTHVGSRERLAAGAIPNDVGHLAGWVSNSQTVKPGNLMPPQPLSPEDLRAVVAYLQGLE
ncbi:cytochrome c oxidase subunit II [Pseudonocardia sp. MH-G8]|uniref:cytochrome c oxidase subunit II n=1 Tax=Pseudonocardia sp. MH-G8 TaxID=1854588 RepID=UPI000B9FCB6C|nr:cytochrome c oxidase subunit II [Pseudonocardia sp. MH-G8]OZM77201.1 cytochrome c oxidase subunit II [Pseudonocardia sp. MH-G8]